jgi:hypothetical protein
MASNKALQRGREIKFKKKQKTRWSINEHRAFLLNLEKNGPNFEAISKAIRTKSTRDVHVHAFNFLNLTTLKPDLEGAELIADCLLRPQTMLR